jgi:hypothetical protein
MALVTEKSLGLPNNIFTVPCDRFGSQRKIEVKRGKGSLEHPPKADPLVIPALRRQRYHIYFARPSGDSGHRWEPRKFRSSFDSRRLTGDWLCAQMRSWQRLLNLNRDSRPVLPVDHSMVLGRH